MTARSLRWIHQSRGEGCLADALAAGADDRLDELMVGVLVAAIQQFRQRLTAMRSIVVAAAEVERADGVVGRTNRVDADTGGCRGRVSKDACLGRLNVFPEAPAAIEDRKSTRLNSSHLGISYAVFCLKKKKKRNR